MPLEDRVEISVAQGVVLSRGYRACGNIPECVGERVTITARGSEDTGVQFNCYVTCSSPLADDSHTANDDDTPSLCYALAIRVTIT